MFFLWLIFCIVGSKTTMQAQPNSSEENTTPSKTSSIDMPLGGENPNPGFLTDQGAPYVTLNEEETKALDKKSEEDNSTQDS